MFKLSSLLFVILAQTKTGRLLRKLLILEKKAVKVGSMSFQCDSNTVQ